MNKNQNWRRVLSLLFAMVMLVSMMVVGSVVASAEEVEPVQDDHYVVALKIGGVTTNYTSFDAAWEAMNDSGNVQVDFFILEDITLTKSYVLEKEKHINYLMSNPASKFTLTGTTSDPLFVINKGRMTVKNINIVSKGDTFQVGGGMLSIQAVGGTSSQRTNITSLEGSVLNMTGGSVDFTGGPVLTALGTQPAVKNDGNGTLTIKQWSWDNDSIVKAPNSDTVIDWAGEGSLNISYGFIDGEIVADDASKVNISGGTFTADMTKYCDPAYCTVKDADGKYVLAPKVLTVNGVAYSDWESAKSAMTASNVEIKFYTDIDSGDLTTLGADRGSLTIDLNGYNWTMRRLSFNSRMTNVTIVNTAERESLIQTVGGDNRLNIGYNTPVDIQSNIAFDGTVQLLTPNGAAGSFQINGVPVLGAKNSGSILESNNTNGSIRITFKNNNLDITLHHGDLLLANDFTTLVSQNIVLNTHINIVDGVTLTIDPTTNLTIGSSGSIDGEGTIAVSSLAHLNLVLNKTAIKNVHFSTGFALDGVVLSDEDMNYTGAANLLNTGVVITAGTFDADVKALCPAGYCVPEENGVWTVLPAHAYDAGVETAPTYEADGYTTYTCTRCGYEYVDVAEGTMKPLLNFKGVRLLLKDGIGIYFMLNTADLVENDYVAVFTFGGKTVEVSFADWKHFQDNFNTGILFDGVDAKSIATEVSVVIMSNGMKVSETQSISVKAYAEKILAGNYADDAKALAEALINYGTIANDAISGNQTAEDVKNTVDADFADLGATMDDSAVSSDVYYGSSVNLNTYLGFNFKFLASAVEGATHAVITYNGKTVTVDASVFGSETKKGNALVVIELDKLLASDAAAELTCTVYNGEEVLATATDSVYNYCARALAGLGKMDETTYGKQSFKSEFYKSLVLYIEAAKNYAEVIEE